MVIGETHQDAIVADWLFYCIVSEDGDGGCSNTELVTFTFIHI